MLRLIHAQRFFRHNPNLVSDSGKPIGLLVIRIVILVMFIAAILFAVRSRSVISSAGIAKPEGSSVTAVSGPLTLVVNSSGDAADTNVGDGLCDSDDVTAGDQCTLRAALQETNSAATDDTINFDLPAGSAITLNTALPEIQGNVTINGPGADFLTVQRSAAGGTPNFRIFTINSGKTVAISGLTIRNGKLTDYENSGGGIYNGGTLTLTNSTVSGNTSSRNGGGVTNVGTFTVTNSTVSGNTVSGNTAGSGGGGGIANFGTFTVTKSTVSGNFSLGSGGGIYNDSVGTLTLTNCTVSGNIAGNPGMLGGQGGGIFTRNSLTLTNTTVSDNTASEVGGGIYIFSGGITMTNSTVSNNTAGYFSGGIANDGAITMTNSTVSGNTAGSGGGGITNRRGTFTVTNSTVSGNFSNGYGGGISNSSTLTLTNSTVSGNTGGSGGGIANFGPLTLTNNTVSGNIARAMGGGIYNDPGGTFTVTNSTVSDNRATSGGGLYNGVGSTTLRNTIVAGNFAGASPSTTANDIQVGVNGVDASSSFNLIGIGGSGGLTNGANNNQVGVSNPGLAPLAYNGGPTLTHALLAGSPAVDAGDNALITNPPFSGPPFTDQRGYVRIFDGPDADATATVDIGAFEQQVIPTDIVTSTNEDTQLMVPFDPGDTSSITSVTATSDTPILIPNDPAHLSAAITGATGMVAINPAANLFGRSIITVTINRSGSNTSQTIGLTVNSVNDAPSFKGADQVVFEDAAQTRINWATNMSAGPADESNQKLTFQITGNTNPGLFAVAPAINLAGTLTYTPAANTTGTATITVALQDDGGTANGGVDTSLQTFTITVRPDTLISFSSPTFSALETDGNAIITLTRTGGVDNEVVAKLNLTDVTTSPADYRFNPGALDTSFNPTCPGTVAALAVQPDGKVLVGSTASISITRFNPDGSADTSFAPDSAAAIGGSVIGLQPDGKIIVSSYVIGSTTRRPARLNSDGSLDTSFDPGMGADGGVTGVAIQPDGKVVIAGAFTKYNGINRTRIARANADGSLDTSFDPGAGLNAAAAALVLQPDGRIIIGLDFSNNYEVSGARVVRLNPNGSVDNSFVCSLVVSAWSVAPRLSPLVLQPDGKIIVGSSGGSVYGGGQTGTIVRLNPNGSTDTSFKEAALYSFRDSRTASGFARQITVQPDGKIIVGGCFLSPRQSIARFKPDGSLDTSFIPPSDSYSPEYEPSACLGALALQPNGKILVAGVWALGKVGRSCLARLDGDLFLNWAAGDATNKTFLLPIVDDSIPEPNETLTLSIVPLSEGAFAGAIPNATLTIINAHDKLPVTISAVSGSGVYKGAATTGTLTATLTSGGTPLGGKEINFSFSPASGAKATTDSNGVAMLTNVPLIWSDPNNQPPVYFHLTPGTWGLGASYAGDATYLAGSGSGVLTVNKAPTTTTVNSSANPSLSGQSVTFTATLTSDLGPPTGGYAQFKVDGAKSGNAVFVGYVSHPTLSLSSLSAGSHTISLDYSGDVNFTASTGTLTQVVSDQLISFSQSNYDANEGSGFVTITVNRTGVTSNPLTVDYATDDRWAPDSYETVNGWAWDRCDFGTAMGTLKFAPGETQKTFEILINRDSYNEGPEAFNVNLSNLPSNASLATPSATVTIADETAGMPNTLDDPKMFVRTHYHDFLNREADPSGLDFWTKEVTSCGADVQCIEVKRINVSASFFLSIEFQDTGYLVERLYKVAYGDVMGTSTLGGPHQLVVPIVRLDEFLPDAQEISQGVIVNQPNWQQQLANNKQAFTAEFVQRSRFTAAFPASMTVAQFVDTLNANAGNPLSQSERDQLVNSGMTRAQMLLTIAENQKLYNAELNRAFVLMEYFGYLRRNPNDSQDTDYTGYDFWLTKLNQFNGNFVNAEMVKAFINSTEYRRRFGAS